MFRASFKICACAASEASFHDFSWWAGPLSITRSQRYVVDFKKKINTIFDEFFYTQIHWTRAGIDAKVRWTDLEQARQLLMIFENFEATLRIIVSETEIYVNCACNEVKMGNSLHQYWQVVGKHLVRKRIPGKKISNISLLWEVAVG